MQVAQLILFQNLLSVQISFLEFWTRFIYFIEFSFNDIEDFMDVIVA